MKVEVQVTAQEAKDIINFLQDETTKRNTGLVNSANDGHLLVLSRILREYTTPALNITNFIKRVNV